MIKTIYFAAGCFWHVQETFDNTLGVVETEVGYMGGDEKNYPNPTYELLHTGKTGYVETVKVQYDEDKISFGKLLDVFWKEHDPTSKYKQGGDVGDQYRSAVFYLDEEQKKKAEISKKEIKKKYSKPIVTEIQPAKTFFRAEDYHQKYLERVYGK